MISRPFCKNPAIHRLWPLSDVFASVFPRLAARPLISLSLAVNYARGARCGGLASLQSDRPFPQYTAGVRGRAARAGEHTAAKDAPNRTMWVAYTVAVLWALHPLATESVTYVLQRTELLMALFLLVTLYCFQRGVESSEKTVWFGLAIVASMLGMGAKETMVMAPLLVLRMTTSSWPAPGARSCVNVGDCMRASPRVGPLAALVLTTNLKSKFSLNADPMSPWKYFEMQWTVIVHYLRLAVSPSGLVLDYSDWSHETPLAQALPAAGLLLVLFVASVWAIRQRLWWGFWGAWFFLLLGPTSSFLPLAPEPATERRMYLPLVAVIVVALEGGDRLCRNLAARFGWPDHVRMWLQAGVVTIPALALGIATIQRNGQYHSAESIWADVVAKRPDDLRGHANLGLALLEDGQAKESIPQFLGVLRISPNLPIVRCDLASALVVIGATNQAIAELQETLRRSPNHAPAHVALADILADQGDQQAALEHYTVAFAINPDEQAAHFNLAQLLTRMGQRDGAITQFMEVLRLDPRNATAHYDLANLLAESGRETEAISHYVAAAQDDPQNRHSLLNLGNLFLKLGRTNDAIVAYTDALRVDPTSFKAHNNLAVIMAHRGDLAHAIEHFREAARLMPNLPEVHTELAEVLDQQGLHQDARDERSVAQRLRQSGTSP